MDIELRMMKMLVSLYPLKKGGCRLGRLLRTIYTRKPRQSSVADVLGNKMLLDPHECVDGGLLFAPKHVQWREVRLLFACLQKGDTFLDIGANIGFYSLLASRLVGGTGRVLAIEADPYNYSRLQQNIRINNVKNITPVNLGVSDKPETLGLGRNLSGNRGGNSFLFAGDESVDVECMPLFEILKEQKVHSVKAAKIDIEGMEYRVLQKFIADAPGALLPETVIIEDHPEWHGLVGGNALELLEKADYQIKGRFRENVVLSLSPGKIT